MNDNEKRRSELLEQMRNHSIPAIHPRYRGAYNSVYQTDTKQKKPAHILRICMILFFLGLGYYTYTEKPVLDTAYIIERIEQEVGRLVDFAFWD